MLLYSKHFYGGHVSNRNGLRSCRVLILREIEPKPWCKCLKVPLNDYGMHVFSYFFENMNLTWLGSVSFEMWYSNVRLEYFTIFEIYFWAVKKEKLFWFFLNLQYNFTYLLIQRSETPTSENFVNPFETFKTLIAKWPGISKIYPPIFIYRVICVLSNNCLLFNSSQGTPCS